MQEFFASHIFNRVGLRRAHRCLGAVLNVMFLVFYEVVRWQNINVSTTDSVSYSTCLKIEHIGVSRFREPLQRASAGLLVGDGDILRSQFANDRRLGVDK